MNEMPHPESSGFVKTLNNMGYMTSSLDAYSRLIIDFAQGAPGPFLDVGAAYGIASLAALEKGCRVIANDIDARHLEILWKNTPKNLHSKLELKPGAFPNEIDFQKDSIGAALLSRIIHFFDGDKIEQSMKKLYDWLAPGGKLVITAETPYLRNFQNFIPIYEARKKSGDQWPGFVDDTMAIDPVRGRSLPKQIHFLDQDVLGAALTKVGFVVEKISTFARPEFPDDIRFDGRESVGVLARKP